MYMHEAFRLRGGESLKLEYVEVGARMARTRLYVSLRVAFDFTQSTMTLRAVIVSMGRIDR